MEGVEEPISTIECNREGNFINENAQAFASAQRCIILIKYSMAKSAISLANRELCFYQVIPARWEECTSKDSHGKTASGTFP